MTESPSLLIILAIIAVIAPTITALAAWRQARVNTRLTAGTRAVADSLTQKADEIHVLVNSNLSKAIADLHLANQRIAGLESLLRTHLHLLPVDRPMP